MANPNWPESSLEALKAFKEAKFITIYTHDANSVWKRIKLALEPATDIRYEQQLFFNETFSRKIVTAIDNENVPVYHNYIPGYIVLTYSPRYHWVIELMLRKDINADVSLGVQVPLVEFYKEVGIKSWSMN